MTQSGTFMLNLKPVDPNQLPLTFTFSVGVGGETIWPISGDPDHPLEIQLDDLFSYLVEFWKPLLLRQTYPFALAPARPINLPVEAAKRWEDMPQEQVDEEASELDAFEEAHNLALAFSGLFDLPPLWMVREAEHMLCDTGRIFERIPFTAVLRALSKIGDEVADHLLNVDPDKWGRVVQAWRTRDDADEINLLSWSASLETKVAERLIDEGLIVAPKSFAEAANDDNELLIAARMASALPTDQIIEILKLARRFGHHTAKRLDELSSAALSHLTEGSPREPFAEGEELATFVRQWLKLGPTEKFDIFGVVESLDVEIVVDAVGPTTFDGLAIAGNSYGPGAFINWQSGRIRERDGSNLRNSAGARVTLAHELCHLVVDRQHSLSAIEVLRSRMPAAVESRARAFAGEILLPSITAAKIWDEAGSPIERDALQAVLQTLVDTYEVSFSVAAWKVQHGARWRLQHESREKFRQLSAMLDILAIHR